jgi:hypothetical protein
MWGYYVRIGSMFLMSSAGRNLATGLTPVQENLPDSAYKQGSETCTTGGGGGGGGGGEEEEIITVLLVSNLSFLPLWS